MPKLRVQSRRLVALLALAAVAFVLAGCQAAVDSFYPPAPITDRAVATKGLYDLVFAIAAVIFFLVEALILWTVVRYRRRPSDTDLPPQTHGNNLVEVIWTGIPLVIVGVLFFLSWQVLNTVDARSTDANQVYIRANAARYQWSFDYLASDGKTILFSTQVPEMNVPAGVAVHLTLQSKDVTHSFYVPEFLFKRDVIPGRENSFDFTIDPKEAGKTFNGHCAQLCGVAHASMLFTVKTLSPADFEAWVVKQTEEFKNKPSPSASDGTGAATGPVVDVTAEGVVFTTPQVTAAADAPFTIKFTNNDAGTPHNIVIYGGADASAPVVFEGEIFSGPDSRLYAIPALKAGSYYFNCKVHPTMTGTLTVQ